MGRSRSGDGMNRRVTEQHGDSRLRICAKQMEGPSYANSRDLFSCMKPASRARTAWGRCNRPALQRPRPAVSWGGLYTNRNPQFEEQTSMMNLRAVALAASAAFCVLLSLPAHSRAEETAAKLKKGDRIIFLGDSITQAGAGPKGYISLVR